MRTNAALFWTSTGYFGYLYAMEHIGDDNIHLLNVSTGNIYIDGGLVFAVDTSRDIEELEEEINAAFRKVYAGYGVTAAPVFRFSDVNEVEDLDGAEMEFDMEEWIKRRLAEYGSLLCD